MEKRGGNIFLSPQTITSLLDVDEGMKIADFGAGGAGFITIPLAKAVGEEGEVYAIDIMKSALKSIEDIAGLYGLSNITPLWSDLEVVGATKITEQSLDLIVLINTLFQTKKHENVLKEAARLLASGKELVIIDWKEEAGQFGPSKDMRLDPAKIIKMAEKVGFELKEEMTIGDFHFGLIFVKK